MINVFRSELFKYFNAKAIYVCMMVQTVAALLEYGFMTLASVMGPGERITQGFIDQFLEANAGQIYKYLYYVLFNSGAAFIAVAVIVVIIVAEDYVQGTQKFAVALSNRSKMAKGKIFTVLFLTSLVHFAGVVTVVMIAWGTRGNTQAFDTYSLKTLLFYTGLGWLVLLAFACVVATVCGFVRNVPGAIAGSIGLYLTGWASLMYLPESVQLFFFMHGAVLVGSGSGDWALLIQALGVCLFTAISFGFVSYWRIRSQAY